MRVESVRRGGEFVYRLFPEPGDPEEGRREFSDSPAPFSLVNREYRTRTPEGFREIHPDVHAAAVWHAVKPVVGDKLSLSFAVSTEMAEWMLKTHGVTLTAVDDRQAPRRAPEKVIPALLFSGGMDSMAAALLMPAGTHHLFLDRIPRLRPGERSGALIDLSRQREACAAVQAQGSPVHITADDHEGLFVPYPMWHSNMAILAALYMADSLGLRAVDAGEVFDAKYFGGYHDGKASGWRMRHPRGAPRKRAAGFAGLRDGFGVLKTIGLGLADCIGGLSEVATTMVVAGSVYRGKSYSCYYPSEDSFCMRCDKCFKKLLLRHIAENSEVPEALFESFLAIPRLRAVFARPYLDWHHVWYYLFQKIRCRHWFAMELQRQAKQGPDLSCLEKWYPGAIADMEPAYADAVLENIGRRVKTMSAEEIKRLEEVDVPPLHCPAPPHANRPPPGSAARLAPAGRPRPEMFPAETKALLKLLKSKLMDGPPLRWGPFQLDDVFLRPGDPGVCLWLSPVPDGGAPSGAQPIIARLFRIGPPGDRFLVRLGTLGLDFESPRPVGIELLRPLVLSLAGVFREARAELA